MNIDAALQVFEAGHMTRTEAARVLAWLLHYDPQRAAVYGEAIHGLIQSGHLARTEAGAWIANDIPPRRNRGGRPRGHKARQRITLYLDPAMVAELDGHKLARYVSRNDLITMLLRAGLDRA